jgi:hypothetical protein
MYFGTCEFAHKYCNDSPSRDRCYDHNFLAAYRHRVSNLQPHSLCPPTWPHDRTTSTNGSWYLHIPTNNSLTELQMTHQGSKIQNQNKNKRVGCCTTPPPPPMSILLAVFSLTRTLDFRYGKATLFSSVFQMKRKQRAWQGGESKENRATRGTCEKYRP